MPIDSEKDQNKLNAAEHIQGSCNECALCDT